GVQGQCHLRPQSNRELMRERTKESWRKRKTPPGEETPDGAKCEFPGDQAEILNSDGEVNERPVSAKVKGLEKKLHGLIATFEKTGLESDRNKLLSAQKQLQTAR